MSNQKKIVYLALLILCLLSINVSGQQKSTKKDTLTYDELVDDYLRIDNDLNASNDSLNAEKELRKIADKRADDCEDATKKAKKKSFWVSVKRTTQDILIGIGIATIAIKLF